MKRLRSYGEDLASASTEEEIDPEKEIDRPLSAAGAGALSSSTSHQRRWRMADNGRNRPGVPNDDRDREVSRVGVRKRFDHDFDGFDDREGPREFRKRTEHDFGNGTEDREAWRGVRKRNDHDLDGFDDREGGRGLRKRKDHDFPDNFDDREGSRGVRKRFEHDPDGFDRRKGFGRYRDRDGMSRGGLVSSLMSPRVGYVSGERDRDRDRDRDRGERDRINRSESFCVSRGGFPKGFRSERDWSKREGSVPSWRRFGSRSKREVDEDSKAFVGDRVGNSSKSGGLDGGSSSRESFRSPHRSKDVKSPTWSKDSRDSVEPLKDVKKSECTVAESGRSGSACEIEEGELQPDSLKESHSQSVVGKEVKHVEFENQTHVEAQVDGNTEKKQNKSESLKDIESSMRDSDGDVRLINKEKDVNASEPDTNEKEQLIKLEAAEAEIAPVHRKLSCIESTCANRACQSEERKHVDSVNNGDRPAFSESLRDDHPECSVPANDELECQAKEEDSDTRVTGPVGEGKVGYALNLKVYDNNGDRPEVSESLGDDHPGSSVLANNEIACQAKEEVNDTTIKCAIGEEKVEKPVDLEVVADDMIVPQASRDVAFIPQVTKDVDIMPEVTKDVDIMPDVTKDVEIMPQVTKEVDIMPQVTKYVDIMPQVTKDVAEGHQRERQLSVHIDKDKGKGVAICSSDELEFAGKGSLIERSFISLRDVSSEGPSIRGFELFSCTTGVKAEKGDKASLTKAENEKMNLEPLELSLALPNVSVPAPSHSIAPPPNSPPRARSVQTRATAFLTGSDGFTTSISFSGSQFNHNPSCSLTHDSVDYDCEQSVKSRPLFQGVDWQALATSDSLPNELLKYQKVPSNVDGSLRLSNSSQGILGQPSRGHASVLDRPGSFQRQLSGINMRNQDDIGSATPAQSAGSQGTMMDRVKENRQVLGEGSGSRLFKSTSHRHMKQVASSTHESDFINSIVGLVVSEPVQAVAWKFSEMADESIRCLKEGIQEMVLKEDHQQQLYSLRRLLSNRSDLTLETLLKSHRVQLEMLVAIKTGLTYFLWRGDRISSVDLAETFLSLKCRNPTCGSALPVDDCDCKFCSKKSGFCSMCMCVVCSKFDTASNTCSWVGCDFCSHWCHTDCGLQKSYIRNGHNVNSTQGTSEMQLYCVACDHPSEMFGFVSDVFKTCAAEWKSDTMLKELEYVKRIFAASNDPRGKLLHGIASQLLIRLKAGSNLQEIYNHIMRSLKDCDSKFGNASASSGRELQGHVKSQVGASGSSEMATATENPIWLKTAPSKDSSADNIGPMLPSTEGSSVGNRSSIWDSSEMQRGVSVSNKKPTQPKPVVDELESLVKIKQAEAKMFQSHSDNARREAERLKHIAIVKSEKIDEEYSTRVAKLQLAQVEEMRRRNLEELQVLERSHQEYTNMKTRMKEDIKELLLRMEDAKKNLVHG